MVINTEWSLRQNAKPTISKVPSTPFTCYVQQPTSIIFSSHLSHPTLKPSNVLVDAVSMTLINGSTIDFATELIGSSFRVLSNPQSKGSGCGCGVSWELK